MTNFSHKISVSALLNMMFKFQQQQKNEAYKNQEKSIQQQKTTQSLRFEPNSNMIPMLELSTQKKIKCFNEKGRKKLDEINYFSLEIENIFKN